ncbi:uncharacterized protein BDR25DRAFT_396584, partial [Lindgomyces ingoldianus]
MNATFFPLLAGARDRCCCFAQPSLSSPSSLNRLCPTPLYTPKQLRYASLDFFVPAFALSTTQPTHAFFFTRFCPDSRDMTFADSRLDFLFFAVATAPYQAHADHIRDPHRRLNFFSIQPSSKFACPRLTLVFCDRLNSARKHSTQPPKPHAPSPFVMNRTTKSLMRLIICFRPLSIFPSSFIAHQLH